MLPFFACLRCKDHAKRGVQTVKMIFQGRFGDRLKNQRFYNFLFKQYHKQACDMHGD